MLPRVVLVAALAGVGCSAPPKPVAPAPSTMSPAEIGTKLAGSVVRITTKTGFGSGAVIREDGWIATNYHVVEGAEEVDVSLADGKKYGVDAIRIAPEFGDLALVHIDKKLVPVKLGSNAMTKPGEHVVAIGNPRGFDHTITDGLYNGRREVDGRTYIQISAPISEGSSGGPIVNEKGFVIGLATIERADAQNLNFGVPVDDLKALITSQVVPMPVAELKARAGADCTKFGDLQCATNCWEANDVTSCTILSTRRWAHNDKGAAVEVAKHACELKSNTGCSMAAAMGLSLAPNDRALAATTFDTLVDLCKKGEPSACDELPDVATSAGKTLTPALVAELRDASCKAGSAESCREAAKAPVKVTRSKSPPARPSHGAANAPKTPEKPPESPPDREHRGPLLTPAR